MDKKAEGPLRAESLASSEFLFIFVTLQRAQVRTLNPHPGKQKDETEMGGSQSQSEKVLLLGLDGAGKTEILQCLTKGQVATLRNSQGVVIKSVRYGKHVFRFHELGGKMERGDSWARHCVGTKMVFFVVDSTDTVRLTEASATLNSVLEAEALANRPLIVVANKQDRITALTSAEVSGTCLGLKKSGIRTPCCFV